MHLASDGRARPLALVVTAGQASDAPAFEALMARIRVPRTGLGRPRTRPTAVLADRAYSSRAIRGHLRRRGIRAVIPQPADQIGHRLRRGRLGGRPPGFDAEAYKRHTSSATPSNAAATASSNGADWSCEPTNSSPPTRPRSASPPSSSGPVSDPRDGNLALVGGVFLQEGPCMGGSLFLRSVRGRNVVFAACSVSALAGPSPATR